jgi:hypothetical protein
VDLRTLYPFSSGVVQADNVVTNAYSDPGTLSGADPDPTIDADDEIALMAADTGPRAPAAYGGVPDGTKPAGATEVKVSAPGTDTSSFVYLFEAAQATDQGAGEDYVDYDFELLAGDYLSNYGFRDGPNPEKSSVETDFYSTGHSDRWINDELRLKTPGASGVDILDREKAQFAPGVCGRSTDTFRAAEGSFVVNRDGPVRAIRSFIGANSGPYTQREHVFYRRHQETRTFLRVHPIPGVMQFTDYSQEASGMLYRNAANPGGVTIDGQPDSIDTGLPAQAVEGRPFWEQVSGPQGSLDIVTRLETDLDGLGVTGYYFDDATPNENEEVQCTGDSEAFGASGSWVNTAIPSTDPTDAVFGRLEVTKTTFYEPPEASVSRAEARTAAVESPLGSSTSPLAPPVAGPRLVASLKKPRGVIWLRRTATLPVRLRNAGQSPAGRIKVCARLRGRAIRISGRSRCRTRSSLAAGRATSLRFRLKARRTAGSGGRAKVVITVFEKGHRVATLRARARLR